MPDGRRRPSPHGPCWRSPKSLVVDPVAVAARVRDHEKPHRARRGIADLMTFPGQHANAAPGRPATRLPFHFHQHFAGDDVEKLLRLGVMMANLGRARRHELLNHAELLMVHQIPGIAIDSPAIMLGILPAHRARADPRPRGQRRRVPRREGQGRVRVSSPYFSSPSDQCNLVGMSDPTNSAATDSNSAHSNSVHSNSGPNPKRELLRHTLATLAYRGGKAVRNAPLGFADFQAGEGVRAPGQILAHIGDLLDWGLSIAQGRRTWHDSKPLPWEQESEQIFRRPEKVRRLPGFERSPCRLRSKKYFRDRSPMH